VDSGVRRSGKVACRSTSITAPIASPTGRSELLSYGKARPVRRCGLFSGMRRKSSRLAIRGDLRHVGDDRRQCCAAAVGPARGTTRSLTSRARQRSRELAPSPSGDCDRRGAVRRPCGVPGLPVARCARSLGWATPTGSNEPLYGRTDTKSPTVCSSMSTSLARREVRSAMTTTHIPPLQVTPQYRRDKRFTTNDRYEQAA
jgi:hypothetical protein